jgi:hypothetical protein
MENGLEKKNNVSSKKEEEKRKKTARKKCHKKIFGIIEKINIAIQPI